jgi:hypothetical protein
MTNIKIPESEVFEIYEKQEFCINKFFYIYIVIRDGDFYFWQSKF